MLSHSPIQLIVGLGNPGQRYANTRHNVGAWLVESLAKQHHAHLKIEPKFKGQAARITLHDHECWILIPNTFMNLSGQAVKALADFYKIPAEAILVAHDELDFPAGVIRLKQGGGAGGHNGLKDTIAQLHTPDFLRLRIGIGHPGDRDLVHDYVLNPPSKHENTLIETAIDNALSIMNDLAEGHLQKAMQTLHSKNENISS